MSWVLLKFYQTNSTSTENRTLWPYVSPEVKGQLPSAKYFMVLRCVHFVVLSSVQKYFVLAIAVMYVTTLKYLENTFPNLFSQKIWFGPGTSIRLYLGHLAYCLSANFREIWFFGRQMIITYGQSCKCDFTLTTSENETDTLPLLKVMLPHWCWTFTQHIQIMKSVICTAFPLEHHALDTGKFRGD